MMMEKQLKISIFCHKTLARETFSALQFQLPVCAWEKIFNKTHSTRECQHVRVL
jgi:hypothetical protein